MDHTAALARISDIFYSGMSDREVCGEITYILSAAGFGPHAIRGGSSLLPRKHELQTNGNVHCDNQWWQAHRADDGRVYRLMGYGNWILPPQSVQDTFRPF